MQKPRGQDLTGIAPGRPRRVPKPVLWDPADKPCTHVSPQALLEPPQSPGARLRAESSRREIATQPRSPSPPPPATVPHRADPAGLPAALRPDLEPYGRTRPLPPPTNGSSHRTSSPWAPPSCSLTWPGDIRGRLRLGRWQPAQHGGRRLAAGRRAGCGAGCRGGGWRRLLDGGGAERGSCTGGRDAGTPPSVRGGPVLGVTRWPPPLSPCPFPACPLSPRYARCPPSAAPSPPPAPLCSPRPGCLSLRPTSNPSLIPSAPAPRLSLGNPGGIVLVVKTSLAPPVQFPQPGSQPCVPRFPWESSRRTPLRSREPGQGAVGRGWRGAAPESVPASCGDEQIPSANVRAKQSRPLRKPSPVSPGRRCAAQPGHVHRRSSAPRGREAFGACPPFSDFPLTK